MLPALLFSCSQDGTLGVGLIPNVNGVGVNQIDTMTMYASTVIEDSLRSSNLLYCQLGKLQDGIFGTTEAKISAQAILPTENVVFGDSLSLDSVILSVRYAGYYGDTNQTLNVGVYELSDDMRIDSTFYNPYIFNTKSVKLGSATITPRPGTAVYSSEPYSYINDSVVTLPPCLRIKIDNSFGQALLNKSGQTELSNNTEFLKWFKGFQMRLESNPSGNGCMLQLNLRNVYSTLSIYYRQGFRRRKFDLTLAPSGATHTKYKNDFTQASAAWELGKKNTLNGMMFLSGLAGMKAKIEIPYLPELAKNRNIILNKAEIQFKEVPSIAPSAYRRPVSLVLVGVDSLGKNTLLSDQGMSYYGGAYDSTRALYSFTITSQIQKFINSASNYGMYVAPLTGSLYPDRLVLGNPVNPVYKPRLILTYTYLNKK